MSFGHTFVTIFKCIFSESINCVKNLQILGKFDKTIKFKSRLAGCSFEMSFLCSFMKIMENFDILGRSDHQFEQRFLQIKWFSVGIYKVIFFNSWNNIISKIFTMCFYTVEIDINVPKKLILKTHCSCHQGISAILQ